MCRAATCGAVTSSVIVMLIIPALLFPWHFHTTKISDGGDHCTVTVFTSWQTEQCVSGPDCSEGLAKQYCPVTSYDWRSVCDIVADGNVRHPCPSTNTTYSVSFALVVLIVIASMLSALGFYVRCCAAQLYAPRWRRRWQPHISVTVGGALISAIVVVYFAVQLPNSISSDLTTWTPSPGTCTVGPCQSFWGSDETITKQRDIIDQSWGPGGWYALLGTLPFWLIAIVLAARDAPRDEHIAVPLSQIAMVAPAAVDARSDHERSLAAARRADALAHGPPPSSGDGGGGGNSAAASSPSQALLASSSTPGDGASDEASAEDVSLTLPRRVSSSSSSTTSAPAAAAAATAAAAGGVAAAVFDSGDASESEAEQRALYRGGVSAVGARRAQQAGPLDYAPVPSEAALLTQDIASDAPSDIE